MTNPYLEAYLAATRASNAYSQWESRRALVQQYAWAIPNDEAIRLLVGLGPLVEIGAGSGYWASLVRQAGGDIVALDIEPWATTHTEVEEGGPEYAGAYHDRTLFLCWPPYDMPMAYDALYGYTEAGGRRVVYVGESRGGCTGDDAFHEMLALRYEWSDGVSLPQWYGLHDTLTVWERRNG